MEIAAGLEPAAAAFITEFDKAVVTQAPAVMIRWRLPTVRSTLQPMPEDQHDRSSSEVAEALRNNQRRRLSICAIGLVVVFLGPLAVP